MNRYCENHQIMRYSLSSIYIMFGCHNFSTICQKSRPCWPCSLEEVVVWTIPPGAGLDWLFIWLDTCQPDPCSSCQKWTSLLAIHLVSPTHGFINGRITEELIVIGSDRRGAWAQRWGPSQPRLVSQKSVGGLPTRPEPTATHIPLSSLLFDCVWNYF